MSALDYKKEIGWFYPRGSLPRQETVTILGSSGMRAHCSHSPPLACRLSGSMSRTVRTFQTRDMRGSPQRSISAHYIS